MPYWLAVNWFGNPEALTGSSDAEMRKVPKTAQGTFFKLIRSGSDAQELTASALISESTNLSASLVIGGTSMLFKDRRDYTSASVADDKGYYRGTGHSQSISDGVGGKGGSHYIVLDDQFNPMWSSVHEQWNTYYQAGKVLPIDVEKNNPRKVGKSKATSNSSGLTAPPDSPL